MKRLTRGLLKGAVVAFVLAATSGAAFAGGNPNAPGTAPGNSANAPGQQKKAAQPAAPAQPAPAAAKPAKSESAPAAKAKAKAKGREKQAARSSSRTSVSAFANPSGKARRNVPSGAVAGYQAHPESFGGPGNSGIHKYTVCHNGHAITVDVHSWNAHVNGHGDTLLPYGTKGKQACGSAAPATPTPATPTPSCPSTATTVVGVWHHTGSNTNPFVLIHPSSHSAHMTGKHPEDKLATVTTTSTAACGASGAPSITTGAPSNTAGGNAAGANNANANASKTVVAGAQKTIASRRNRAGGVLGATKHAGNVLASAVRKGQLPFTGFPIWLVALIGAGLISGGFALRRVRPTTT
jgi:hypothetical protein